MKLSRDELLKGSKEPEVMKLLIEQAEWFFRTSQTFWSDFISASVREDAIKRMRPLNNLRWETNGGHPLSERRRMLCKAIDEEEISLCSPQIQGIHIEGNFLFDKPSQAEIRNALEIIGVAANQIGDIWIQNDRGAQAFCTCEAAETLNGKNAEVREIKLYCEAIDIKKIKYPNRKIPKRFNTVEASYRLDAIASAGFGVSRTKIVAQIKAGKIRLNWEQILQASKEVNAGDQIQHEDKGNLKIISINPTKRNRWAIELYRE